jgi:hypothetical protein
MNKQIERDSERKEYENKFSTLSNQINSKWVERQNYINYIAMKKK